MKKRLELVCMALTIKGQENQVRQLKTGLKGENQAKLMIYRVYLSQNGSL